MTTLSKPPRTVRPQNLVAQIGDDLRRRIQSGVYKAGERLKINELAREYDVSATPVREVLAKLAAEELVSLRDNAGYSVREAPTDEEYALWAEARIAIEFEAVLLAKRQSLEEGIKALESANAAIARGTDSPARDEIERFSDANWAFHRALVSLARNRFLMRAHETLYQGKRFSQVFLGHGVRDRAGIVEEHQTIIDLLKKEDFAAAAEAVSAHIRQSTDRDRLLSAKHQNPD